MKQTARLPYNWLKYWQMNCKNNCNTLVSSFLFLITLQTYPRTRKSKIKMAMGADTPYILPNFYFCTIFWFIIGKANRLLRGMGTIPWHINREKSVAVNFISKFKCLPKCFSFPFRGNIHKRRYYKRKHTVFVKNTAHNINHLSKVKGRDALGFKLWHECVNN